MDALRTNSFALNISALIKSSRKEKQKKPFTLSIARALSFCLCHFRIEHSAFIWGSTHTHSRTSNTNRTIEQDREIENGSASVQTNERNTFASHYLNLVLHIASYSIQHTNIGCAPCSALELSRQSKSYTRSVLVSLQFRVFFFFLSSSIFLSFFFFLCLSRLFAIRSK